MNNFNSLFIIIDTKIFKIEKMKRTLFLLMGILPLFLIAQNNKNYFENATIEVAKTPINTPASDFGPSYVDGELWFSAFTLEEISKVMQGKTDDVYYNLYAAPFDTKGNLTGKKTEMLNGISAGYHAGPVSYCHATEELFITLSNYENPKIENVVFRKANIPLKIIIMKKSGKGWNKAGELPFNSPSYNVGHPAISVTGDTLFFASDKTGPGIGGTDIYMSVRKNGKWGEMINLGNNINTPGEDMFPFLNKGNTLIYASNGKSGGKGGLDLYYANISDNNFGTPVNIEDINSAEDDFGLVIQQNQKSGYFVSRREGGIGDDDIYKVLFKGDFDLELLVRDKKSLSTVNNAKVNFNDDITLYTDNNGMIKRELEDETDYTATSAVEGYMNESVDFTTKDKLFGTIKAVIEIEKVEVGQKFVMENIYYDFDKWDILSESEVELDKLVKILKDNPSWKVELGSHTDCRGNDRYNDILSDKRSASAVNYITSNGITKDRITSKGYGETQLVNHCDDGVSCTESQHRLNRRTEFKILEMN